MKRQNLFRYRCIPRSSSETTNRVSAKSTKPYFLMYASFTSFLFSSCSLISNNQQRTLIALRILALCWTLISSSLMRSHNSTSTSLFFYTPYEWYIYSTSWLIPTSRPIFGLPADSSQSAHFRLADCLPPSGGASLHSKLPFHSYMGGVKHTSLSSTSNEFFHR